MFMILAAFCVLSVDAAAEPWSTELVALEKRITS